MERVLRYGVAHKDVTGLRTYKDLSGKDVYVRRSSSYFNSLFGINVKIRARGLKPLNVVPVDEDINTESILEMVNAGIARITIADAHLAGRAPADKGAAATPVAGEAPGFGAATCPCRSRPIPCRKQA